MVVVVVVVVAVVVVVVVAGESIRFFMERHLATTSERPCPRVWRNHWAGYLTPVQVMSSFFVLCCLNPGRTFHFSPHGTTESLAFTEYPVELIG